MASIMGEEKGDVSKSLKGSLRINQEGMGISEHLWTLNISQVKIGLITTPHKMRKVA